MNVVRTLGGAALVLGVAAPLAGSPYRSVRAQIDIAELAGAVTRGEDHVSALQLAAWIRDRKPGLRVVDVRTPAEFATFAVPTAENVPIADIAKARFGKADTVVLYSEGGAHAGQAWVFLKAAGVRQVYFLRGGLGDWMEEVVNPTISSNASAQQTQAFEATAELSRYFGGQPRIGERAAAAVAEGGPDVAAMVERARRRGC